MKYKYFTKHAPFVPFIAIIACLVVLSLYEGGIIRLHSHKKAKLDVVEFSSSELVPYTPEYYSQNLLLVNSTHTLSEDFVSNITYYRETDVLMNEAILYDYGRLSDYIRENMDNHLYVSSTYRSYEDQQRVYEEEGPEIAALPGESEHQTGLALDVYVMYFAGSAFTQSPVGQYVNESCQDYGFIIRYPEGASDITGFEYEPWHIRYVGFPHAQIITNNEITLEEYIDSFVPGTWYQYDYYLICRQDSDNLLIPSSYEDNDIICGYDNTGYTFITIDIS